MLLEHGGFSFIKQLLGTNFGKEVRFLQIMVHFL